MSDPLLGITSPIRLLREQWRTPVELAQELYAMFTAKGPREIHDTLTIRVPEGKPALRVIREEADTIVGEAPSHSFRMSKVQSAPVVEPPRRRAPRREDIESARRPFDRGEEPTRRVRSAETSRREEPGRGEPTGPADVEFDASASFTRPVTFDRATFRQEPVILDPRTGRARPLGEFTAEAARRNKPLSFGSSEAQGVFAAIVALDGQVGAEPQCNIYPNGFDEPLTDPDTKTPVVVTVRIPVIAEDESIPRGFIFFPVFKFGGEYWTQPAVWGR